MFRFIELEIHGWDFWPSLSVPLNAGVVILSGRNGSGKTTMLDAIRQLLHAPQLSHRRRISHYLRHPNQPALLRAVVSNAADSKGRRPFERQQILSDEATLACALLPNGGSPEKRFVVLAGRVGVQELQGRLLESRDWLGPEDYRRVLEYAGVSRARDRDGAVADISGEAEGTVEIDPKNLQVHFKPISPKFANKYGYHGEPRCANEISFSLYGIG